MNQAADSFKVKDFGPIKNADVKFGDLTVLIGPQASGKSIFLELFKLVNDHDSIVSTLKNYNYIFDKTSAHSLLEYYFGEGFSSLINSSTNITVNNHDFTDKLTDFNIIENYNFRETVFYVPAQRILSIADGRPKNFMEFDLSTPYALRIFSETLRVYMQGGLGNPDVIFPMKQRLKNSVRDSINNSIFHNGKVIIDQSGGQRKMKLSVNGMKLPFMTWSAGQKEFMPLLLAIYCVTEPSFSMAKHDDYKWIIIEEPEMGLHPKAIETVIIEIIELMQQGFRVILSTHSTIFLDFVWALKLLADIDNKQFTTAMCDLFGLKADAKSKSIFNGLQSKNMNVYYFDSHNGAGVESTDISSLNVMDNNPLISEWGGLSSFAGRASEIVGKYTELRNYEYE